MSTESNLFHHRETTYRVGWMIWICCSHALERRCLIEGRRRCRNTMDKLWTMLFLCSIFSETKLECICCVIKKHFGCLVGPKSNYSAVQWLLSDIVTILHCSMVVTISDYKVLYQRDLKSLDIFVCLLFTRPPPGCARRRTSPKLNSIEVWT